MKLAFEPEYLYLELGSKFFWCFTDIQIKLLDLFTDLVRKFLAFFIPHNDSKTKIAGPKPRLVDYDTAGRAITFE